ncbi:hypothetical protein FRX31_015371 [Thalictrum thalictroides]|uniref:Uncharacterized protein n=1 Tax=Thalictrum thalictroides TaxID=46969 RepID=A0A7J6WCI3_THATH|nr:hypothetical protein FRX31_015371 [Thalictrum thalictroides]
MAAMNKSNTMSSLYNKVEEKESSRGLDQRFNNRTPTYVRSLVRINERDDDADDSKKVVISKEVDINESAEAFISRFRQQLRIERLNSIENYKQYLERGL